MTMATLILALCAAAVIVRVHDAGTGFECPDAIVLTRDETWSPPQDSR